MGKTTTILARELIGRTNKLIIQSLILIQESKEILERSKRNGYNSYCKNSKNPINCQKTS